MTELLEIPCPHCDAVNRVPGARLAQGPKCGTCHSPLFADRPLALAGTRFARQFERSDVPLLIDFWAPWCAPCRAMAPEFERATSRLEPHFRLVKVDVDEAPEIAAQFRIQSVPTLVLARRGREIARSVGGKSANAIESWVMANAATPAE